MANGSVTSTVSATQTHTCTLTHSAQFVGAFLCYIEFHTSPILFLVHILILIINIDLNLYFTLNLIQNVSWLFKASETHES